jgi:5-methylcytosine-specific restriction endonuclease McrA
MTSLRGHDRQEFSQKVRKLAFARCCKNGTKPGIPQCENCGRELRAANIEFEHLKPAGLGGEPTLENCGVWCAVPCSSKKTHEIDNPRMAKADRVLKKTYGLTPSKQKMQGQGFQKRPPQRTASRPIERKTERTPA